MLVRAMVRSVGLREIQLPYLVKRKLDSSMSLEYWRGTYLSVGFGRQILGGMVMGKEVVMGRVVGGRLWHDGRSQMGIVLVLVLVC